MKSMKTTMRLLMAALLLAAIGLATTPVPVRAAPGRESYIFLHNKSDAYVRETVYDSRHRPIGASRCIAPGTYDPRELVAEVYEVRVELTHVRCSDPVMLDVTRGFPYRLGYTIHRATYYVHGSRGNYVFTE